MLVGRVVAPVSVVESSLLPAPAAAVAAAPDVAPAPEISVVVPGLNEGQSLPELARRIHAALEPLGPYELIFVDDGSTDDTWRRISELHEEQPSVRGVSLRRNFGKAMALKAGFQLSRAPILVMMDADLQDDPEDLPQFIAKIREGFDVVVGWKVKRQDPLNRRILSKIFNGTVSWLTKVKLHDMNCGFKAYRREVIETVPIYGDLFRFIPALANASGFRITEIPIKHHSRQFGKSRYGLERLLRGLFDLVSVLFLIRYARSPMHLFGLVGLVLGAGGLLINGYLSVLWFTGHGIGHRPLLLLGVLMTITGVQFASFGLLGEFLAYQGQKQGYLDALPVRKRVGF